MKKRILLAIASSALFLAQVEAQLVVSTALTPAQLVQDVLLGSGVTVSNITYNGVVSPLTPQPGTGSFTQTGTLGLEEGVILSCGNPASVVGPADGFILSDDIGNNGNDPDLESIMGGNLTNYSILEFDFVTVGDSVKFNYVFGSEEYPNFVCSFNDAFGFFLSGPGISGPYTLGAINIAVLPDGVTPVTIANVNGGGNNDPNDPFCPAVNPEYYVNNTASTTIAYNGLTTVLRATAAVQCGETYHIKLAVADAGGEFGDTDTAYDSGVFLEAGSFSSSPFVPQLTPGPGIVGNTVLESCFPVAFAFVRLGDVTEEGSYDVSYSGTFTNGVDIVPALPEVVFFPAGVAAIPFSFTAPIDPDTDENFIITVISVSDCTGDTIENVFTFQIAEVTPLVPAPVPYSVNCGASVDITVPISGGYGAYVYDWGFGDQVPVVSVAPLSDEVFPVTILDNCGLSVTTEVAVTVIPAPNPFSVAFTPGITVQGNQVQESCFEVSLVFTRSGSSSFVDTVYVTPSGTATFGVDYTGLLDQVIFPVGVSSVSVPVVFPQDADLLESFVLTLGDASICNGGFSEVTFNMAITQGSALVAVGAPATIPCGGSATLQAVHSGGYAPYTYAWPNSSSGQTFVVSPTAATTYTLTVTDTCGTTAEAVYNVDLTAPAPVNLSIIGQSVVTEACTSTSINLIRPSGVQGDLVVNMTYAGQATNGSDYDQPATRTIGSGLLNVIFPFEPVDDGEVEDGETVMITASFTDACGRTVSSSVTITIQDAPLITLETVDHFVECSEDSLALVATASGGFGGLDLTWNTGDVGTVIYVQTQTTNTYTVTATDACGRTASASSTVNVDCEIVIPNVFTPNGDGKNDRFDIDGILSTQNTVKIFNRWGQIVYETKNYRNNWSAVGIPDGTYFYEVSVDRGSETFKGHVTILR